MKKTMTIAKAFKMRATIRKEIEATSLPYNFALSKLRVKEDDEKMPLGIDAYYDDKDLAEKIEKAYAEKKQPVFEGRTYKEYLGDYLAAYSDWNALNVAIDNANQKVRTLLLEEDYLKGLKKIYASLAAERARMQQENPEQTSIDFGWDVVEDGETSSGNIKTKKVKKYYKDIVVDGLLWEDFTAKLDGVENRLVEIRDEITYIDNSTKIEVELTRDWK